MFSIVEYPARKPPNDKGQEMASWQSDHLILPPRSRKRDGRKGVSGNDMSSEDIPTVHRDGLMGIHDIGNHNRARLIIAQGIRFRRAVCEKPKARFCEGHRYIS